MITVRWSLPGEPGDDQNRDILEPCSLSVRKVARAYMYMSVELGLIKTISLIR